jgi:hypothetical protein
MYPARPLEILIGAGGPIERQVCFEIPVIIDRWPPEEPDPRFRDWRLLATIDDLAGRLSGDIGGEIQAMVDRKMQESLGDLQELVQVSRTQPARDAY